MIGLNPHTFGYFILICAFANVTALMLGMMISAFSPSVEAATALGPSFIIIGVLFGGFYINVNSLPPLLNLIPYISLFRWAYEALCINEFQGETFTCDSSPGQCITDGEEVLKTLSYDGHTTSYPVFALGMVLVTYICVLYIILALNQIRFTPLGYIGKTFKRYVPEQRAEDSAQVTSAESVGVKGKYEHVNESDNDGKESSPEQEMEFLEKDK